MERPPAAGAIPNRLALAAWLLLPVAAHLAFSRFGFNPTDDGFVLAMSRRLLDGQIPHRDFISIRPVGSALLHLPEVWLGGALTLWLGRFVTWCEFAVIAFCSAGLAARITKEPIAPMERLLVGTAGFVLASHTFPLMPWHTVDALVLASCGLLMASGEGRARSTLGFLLVGAAGLCRQNFLAMIPLAVFGLGRHRSWRPWLAALAPSALYALSMTAFGAARDACIQLTAQTVPPGWGVLPYVRSPFTWVGFVVGLGCTLLLESRPPRKGRGRTSARHRLALGAMATTLAAAGLTMLRSDYFYLDHAAYMVFGVCAGQLMALVRHRSETAGRANLLLMATATAWITSVSFGYNTPALALAGLACAALVGATRPFRVAAGLGERSSFPRTLLAALVVVLILAWIPARLGHVYLDRPARQLDHRLDGVLPGAALISTNPNTYEFLSDLHSALQSVAGPRYAVIPDCAALWIRAPEPNPLPIDWPQSVELNRPELLQRVLTTLDQGRGQRRILVQKVYARELAKGFVPLESSNYFYAVVVHVRANFRKVGETRWFEIYE